MNLPYSYHRVKHLDKARFSKRDAVILISLAVLLVLVVTKIGEFKGALAAMADANRAMLVWAGLFSAASYLAAAGVFWALALKPLRYGQTLLIQLAASFTNRLLPAGAGAVATYNRFLIKGGHSRTQAAALVSVNAVLGFLGLMLLIAVAALITHNPIGQLVEWRLPGWVKLGFLGLVAYLVILLALNRSKRTQLLVTAKKLLLDLKSIGRRPLELATGLGYAILISVCYDAVLYFSSRAVGLNISVLQMLLVHAVGVAAATITPTPGGVGGAEAGLVAGLVAYGATPDLALSAALIFRLLTFWLPILPGFAAFQVALDKNYV